MITLNAVSLRLGNKLLLEDANVSLTAPFKIGLVGPNGCGKSTFFKLILNQLQPDQGSCSMNPHLRISHLAQEVPESNETVLMFVLQGDQEYFKIKSNLICAEKEKNHTEIAHYHDKLHEIGGYSRPAKAASILSGLGFNAQMQERTVNTFSGGWRMRLNLAKCLMSPSDLLLLDEPTNHLDLPAIYC